MGISLKTHKMLWGRSGMMCAFPDCKRELVSDESETDDPSLVGEEAHIVGKKEDSPRGKSNLPFEQRDKFDNLILLCSIHHKIIDDQVNTYTVDVLKNYKREHLKWVKNNLSQDLVKQREDEIYASYIDKFMELCEVDSWKDWTSYIFGSGQPHIRKTNLVKLREFLEFVVSRVWFNRYPKLEKALYNFKNVANDFIRVFEEYAEEVNYSEEGEEDNVIVWTRKFYQISEWNPELYQELGGKYDYHHLLVEDLALEMTRAANYIFEIVRAELFPSFRIQEGVLLIMIGPFSDFRYKTVRTEYSKEEKKELYPDLRNFMEIREKRDYCRGQGVSEDYFSPF